MSKFIAWSDLEGKTFKVESFYDQSLILVGDDGQIVEIQIEETGGSAFEMGMLAYETKTKTS